MWSDAALTSSDSCADHHPDGAGIAQSGWQAASVGAESLDEILGAGWEDGSFSFESDLRL